MEAEDILLTFAEVSVALAGFIGIAAAFRRKEGDWAAHDIGSVRFVLEVSFTALFFAVTPGVLWNFGASEPWSWRGAAVLLGGWLLLLYGFQSRRRRRLARIEGALRAPIPWRPALLVVYVGISVGVLVSGLTGLAVRGTYLLGIGMLLVAAAIEFLSFAASLEPVPAGDAAGAAAGGGADASAAGGSEVADAPAAGAADEASERPE